MPSPDMTGTNTDPSGDLNDGRAAETIRQVGASQHPRSIVIPRRREISSDGEVLEIQKYETSRLDKLPDQVDSLRKEVRDIKNIVRELQRDNYEKLTLQRALEAAQDQLQESNTVMEETRKKWKKATSLLNQIRAKETLSYQLPDSDLANAVQQLRYSIRAFSVQYYAGKGPEFLEDPPSDELWNYMLESTPGSDCYLAYLASDTAGPMVIQSFIWRFLVGKIFERFCWVPAEHEAVTKVYETLRPVYEDEPNLETSAFIEDELKFQMWKATTSNLLLESKKGCNAEIRNQEIKNLSRGLSTQALDLILPFARKSGEGISTDLQWIIENSIFLDREIFRQAARVDWIFPLSNNKLFFDPNIMDVDMAEMVPQAGQPVEMVTAPMLKKRSKHGEERSENEYVLMKMSVTCRQRSCGLEPQHVK